jgi:hypothetical protein
MSDRDRLLNAATGLALYLALAFCLTMAGLEYAYEDSGNPGAHGAYTAEQLDEAAARGLLQIETSTADTRSANEQYHERQDLAAQRGMAVVAALQLAVSALGLYFLIRTLEYTADATQAAASAADAAREGVKLAEKELFELRRPYVVATIMDFHLWAPNARVRFKLSNIGELPADVFDCFAEIGWAEPHWRRPKLDAFGGENMVRFLESGEILSPKETTKPLTYVMPQRLGVQHRRDFYDRMITFYFWGRFSYTDPSGARRDAGFFYEFQPVDTKTTGGRVKEAVAARSRFGTFDRKAQNEGEKKGS